MHIQATIFALILVSLIGCTSIPQAPEYEGPRTTYTEEEANHEILLAAADKAQADVLTKIIFNENSSALTTLALFQLNSLLQFANNANSIEQAIVLSWPDDEYPREASAPLPHDQLMLAEQRNQSIENFLGRFRGIEVETFNMAERPSEAAENNGTTEAQIKDALVRAGLPSSTDEFQYPSNAARALILLKLEKRSFDPKNLAQTLKGEAL